ncbi:MAG TPA: hypothetical protein VKJ65_10855, partial [Phycisphaerae bacterium]|nr:hypothetical protein [Phycisphaerae bacterium]
MIGIFSTGAAYPSSPVTLSLNPKTPGPVLPDQFLGVSYETQQMLPDASGHYYFGPENQPLINMFKTMGIKNLRIGGNTVDNNAIPIPGHADIDSLFAFAQADGVHVIYSVRLKQGNADQDAAIAQYVAHHYAAQLSCFAIGNEPNIYLKKYALYGDTWQKFMNAILAAVPGAKFCGPSAITASWVAEFADQFGSSGHLAFVCVHNYPGGAGNKVKDPAAARSAMLSTKWVAGYEALLKKFAPIAQTQHLPWRIEETNSFFNGGAINVSDTYTSSLWSLDYLYWFAFHSADGLNFHTGDEVAAGNLKKPCRYALFWTAPDGYMAHPEAYGVLAFSLAAHGREIPVTFVSNPDAVNLTAYGILAPDGSLYVTLINKDNGTGAHDAMVKLNPGNSYSHAQFMRLVAPHNDLSLTAGVTLGGATIEDNGTWNGQWSPLGQPATNGQISIDVPA